MTINGPNNTDPTLNNQNRTLNNQNDNTVDEDTVTELVDSGPVNLEEAIESSQSLETVSIVDIDTTNEIGTESTEEPYVFTNKAGEGYNGETDALFATELTATIRGGADINDTFNSELLKMAEERYGTGSFESLGETTNENGDRVQNYMVGATGEEFSIIEHQYNDTYGLEMSSLAFDDDSQIQLYVLDGAVGGAGIHRVSGEKEDGTKDFTKVSEYVIQEGTASMVQDHNGNEVYQENFDQINRYDGTFQSNNVTTYHTNGMLTTEYEKDGEEFLYVANGNHSASQTYSAEDGYANPVDTNYAVLGEDGFVSDWDDGSNVNKNDALYKDFDEMIDPFLAEILAEINDPSGVGEVDGDEESVDEGGDIVGDTDIDGIVDDNDGDGISDDADGDGIPDVIDDNDNNNPPVGDGDGVDGDT
ncbi:MAG: hypothetical protein HRT47_06430, partial [Candidatus Caenarcaniphilales bacterium]|nr:hypothetical protein [Candidatus Caenarcaniphilales bacterium]